MIKSIKKFFKGVYEVLKDWNDTHKAWIKGRGYKYSKPLILGFFAVSFVLLVVVVAVDGYEEKLSVSCPDYAIGFCENPLVYLDDCSHYCCEIDFLAPGYTCGEPVSWLGRNYGFVVFLLFVITLLLNHYLFNKGYDFDKYWGEWK